MVTLSPVGLAAAPVANQVSFLATFKEKLCRCVCATSTNQTFATVAHKVANDPDWYDGMIFCRWTADAIGKSNQVGLGKIRIIC